MIDIEELKKAALAATQGEWVFGSFHELLVVPVRDGIPDKYDPIANLGETAIPWDMDTYSAERYKNAEHIATANPSAILELIARLEAAESQLETIAQQAEAIRLKDAALIAVRDDLELRMRIAEDDSLNISNSVLDKMCDAIDLQPSPEILQARDERVTEACVSVIEEVIASFGKRSLVGVTKTKICLQMVI